MAALSGGTAARGGRCFDYLCSINNTKMPNKKIQGSLSGIVDKMNKAYDGRIGTGFNLGLDRRVVPLMKEGTVVGWKMQRCENDVWVDLDGSTFETMEELIAFYKEEKH